MASILSQEINTQRYLKMFTIKKITCFACLLAVVLYASYQALLAYADNQKEQEFKEYMTLAQKGNIRGIGFMYQHYGLKTFYADTSSEKASSEIAARYWRTKLADAGDASTQFGLGKELVDKQDFFAGCAYIKRSAAQGYVDAIKFLRETKVCLRLS